MKVLDYNFCQFLNVFSARDRHAMARDRHAIGTRWHAIGTRSDIYRVPEFKLFPKKKEIIIFNMIPARARHAMARDRHAIGTRWNAIGTRWLKLVFSLENGTGTR